MIFQVDKILNCMNTFFFFIEYCKSKVRGPQISIFPYSCQFRNKCKYINFLQFILLNELYIHAS